MPLISRFLGIRIYMYFGDHNPPHFHAKYGEYEAEFDIHTLGVITGRLPRRVHMLVVEWALLHQEELWQNWELVNKGRPFNRIQPLT